MNNIDSLYSKVIRFTLFAFLFLLPLIILPGAMHKFAIAKLTLFRVVTSVVLVSWLMKILSDGRIGLRQNSLNLPIAFLVAASIFSTVFSLSPSLSLVGAFFQRQEGLLTLFGYVILFLATANFLGEKEKLLAAVKVLAVSSILVSLYGIAQHFGYDVFSYRLLGLEAVRSFSTFGNPDLLGSFLVLVVPLSLGLVLVAKNPKEYALGIAAFLSTFSALVFSFTRGAWLGAVLGLAAMCSYVIKRKHMSKKIADVVLLLVIAIISVVAIDAVKAPESYSLKERVSSFLELGKGTSEARLLMWKDSLKVIRARPLLGWGPETFKDAFVRYRSPELARGGGKRSYVERPHNQVLYAAASTGVLGVFSYFWLIVTFSLTILAARKGGDRDFEGLKLAVLGSGLGYFVQEQFLFSFVSVTPLLWMILGFAVCLAGAHQKEQHISLSSSSRYKPFLLFLIISLGFLAAAFSVLQVDADLQAGRGREAIVAGNLQGAGFCFQRATTLNPWEPRYRYYLGAVYNDAGLQSGQVFWFTQAEEVYRGGLRLNAYDSQMSQGLADTYYNMSQITDSSNFNSALEAYSRTIELDPLSTEAHLRSGNILLWGGKWNQSLQHFKAVLVMEPTNLEALTGIARVYEEKGELVRAKEYFEKVLEYDSANQSAAEGLTRVKERLLDGKR